MADSNISPNSRIPVSSGPNLHNATFTPRSVSIADDSDAEFEPTPVHSPGGPDYDDLPPSYDEAREQANNGIIPIDPSQLEAHCLTLNEGPDHPEVWEYCVRGTELDALDAEQAPSYESHVSGVASTVPVQHVSTSNDIPVGRVGNPLTSSTTGLPLMNDMLARALEFTTHQPDADVAHAPRLARPIAIPQDDSTSSNESVQILRAYAKALHTHSIRPGEFVEFLDGLNTLCKTMYTTASDMLQERHQADTFVDIIRQYIDRANEAFFAPRGLRVSLRSLSALVELSCIPHERGQRAGAIASVLDPASTAEKRAQSLHPWIEALDPNVPAQSSRTLLLHNIGNRLREQGSFLSTASHSTIMLSRETPALTAQGDHADPPHSIPDQVADSNCSHGSHGAGRRERQGRARNRRGNRPPSSGPFGLAGQGPFGPPHYSRGYPNQWGSGRGPSQSTNEWAALGQNIGKWGEEFGKSMGQWGEQFGKRAAVWGQDVGRNAEAWGGQVAVRASGSGSQWHDGRMPPPSSAQTHDDLPPSYVDESTGQQRGVLRTDSKAESFTSASPKGKGKPTTKTEVDDNNDDASSISSDTSDSDTDSDSDDEAPPDTNTIFLQRIHSINKQADLAASKGKKSAQEIAYERSTAIAKAQKEKTAMDLKLDNKASKRAAQRELRQRGRELRRQHRQKKRELRAAHVGKGKGKSNKTKEWREAKREYREKKKELRKEKMNARKEWRDAKNGKRRMKREGGCGVTASEDAMHKMVWVVIENVDT